MELKNYPAEIEAAAVDVAMINLRITDYRRAMGTVEDTITFEVCFAVSPETGKPLFSNEAQRSVAIRDRQRDNEQYKNLQKNLDGAEMAKALSVAKLERLRGEFSVSKLETRLKAAELELEQLDKFMAE